MLILLSIIVYVTCSIHDKNVMATVKKIMKSTDEVHCAMHIA
jgi:hypothetical protein